MRGRIAWLVLALAGCEDVDGDGFAGGRDCDDSNPTANPSAPEVCDGVDNDCDGYVDEEVSFVAYWDRDRDGFGDEKNARRVCNLPEDGARIAGDCDDLNAAAHPDGVESCDLADNDCDGEIDEDVGETFYRDADGDGHGDPDDTTIACFVPTGFSRVADDCDDTEGLAWAGAAEACDEVDNNCDGRIDEDLAERLWPVDADGDGYGDPTGRLPACGPISGLADNDLDCDDADPAHSPATLEDPGNGQDEDCDGYVDETAVPGHVATLDAAVAEASPGDIIQLGEGSFSTTVDLTGHDITLAGAGCGRTLLFGDRRGTTVTLDGGTVERLTVAGGSTSGVIVRGDATLRDLCVEANESADHGGGIRVESGTLTLEDALITANRSQMDGGGVYVGTGADLVARRVRFVANRSERDGGGLTVHSGDVEVVASVFAANYAEDDGGAVATKRPESSINPSLDVRYATFVGNELGPDATGQDSDGTALYLPFADASLSDLLIVDHGLPDEQAIVQTTITGDVAIERIGLWRNGDQDRLLGWIGDALRFAPRFVDHDPDADPRDWDLRLSDASPYVDAGDPTALDPDGSVADLGAYGGPDAPATFDAPRTVDTDADTLFDVWEEVVGLAPWRDDAAEDPDADGLSNADELAYGTHPARADSDADGVDDASEVAAGDDPLSPLDQAPIALVEDTRWSLVGDEMVFDASGSVDPGGDALAFTWRLDAPAGSALTDLADPKESSTGFTPDVAGAYTVSLDVSDGVQIATWSSTVYAWDATIVPDDVADLADAVRDARSGDVIALRPGTYNAALVLSGQDLTIVGLGEPDDVVIDADGAGSAVWAQTGALRLERLTLTGGAATLGGGLRSDDVALVMRDVVVRNNAASFDGGGLSLDEGTAELIDVVVRANTATSDGGGIHVNRVDLRAVGLTIQANIAGGLGGGMHVVSVTEPTDVFQASFQANDAPQGAAVWFDGGSDGEDRFRMEQVVFAEHVSGDAVVYAHDNAVGLINPLFIGNATTWLVAAYDGANGGRVDVIFPALWSNTAGFSESSAVPATAVTSDPDVILWVDDDDPTNDVWTVRPDSPLRRSGHPDRIDPGGTRSTIGLGGGGSASRLAVFDGLDLDADGLADGWELRFGQDPSADDSSTDLDGDGLTAAQEYALGTRPDLADTDGDGLDDAP